MNVTLLKALVALVPILVLFVGSILLHLRTKSASSLIVKRQQVVSGLVEATHGCDPSDALMWAMPVVMMRPPLQHHGALRGAWIGNPISPFAQSGLDEALGLAVGLRAVGASEAVLEAEPAAGSGEALGAKGGAIVGEYPFDRYAEAGKVGHAGTQESNRAGAAFIEFHLGKADPRMVINGHEQVFPTDPIDAVAGVAGDAVAEAHDARQFFGVDMQQV